MSLEGPQVNCKLCLICWFTRGKTADNESDKLYLALEEFFCFIYYFLLGQFGLFCIHIAHEIDDALSKRSKGMQVLFILRRCID